MKIEFIHSNNIPADKLSDLRGFSPMFMEFEKIHVFNWNVDEKIDFFRSGGEAIWMYVEGHAVGEQLFESRTSNVVESISTSILPDFQQLGYSKLLRIYFYSCMKRKGLKMVIGMCKQGAATKMIKSTGGKILQTYKKYRGTLFTYYTYKHKL